MIRSLLAVLGIPVAFALAIASMPWLLYGMGAAMVGDEARADRAFASCPLSRYMDWIEARP